MLTLITGTPGAGKTLYAVSEIARKVPESTIEAEGVAVPRRLLSNVTDLLVEHEKIGPEELNTWHEWARPGDVILYDEVQELWRPRSFGKDVPPAIAALETHRHKGVDIILLTQHPMLLDANIRRLVNQHLHVRRIASGFSWIYEWDHCANISTLKTALQSKVWRYPKDVFALYKSAQLHTKPVQRMPRLALLGVLALVGFAFLSHYAYERINMRFEPPQVAAANTDKPPLIPVPGQPGQNLPGQMPQMPDAMGAGSPAPADGPRQPVEASYLGCISNAKDCRCYDHTGLRVPVEPQACRTAFDWGIRLVVAGGG